MAGDSVFSLQLDPARSNFLTILGRKGSGKSVLADWFWRSYPFDRLVIDPTGDVGAGQDAVDLEAPLPTRWPGRLDDKRSTLRYVPDPGSPTYADDLDRAVGLAHYHRRCLLWIDEVGELTRANKTGPHMRRALRQGRHRRLSLLMCEPRPVDIDPLVMSQADVVCIFSMPHPHDQRRVAEVIGVKPDELAGAIDGLPRFGFLAYDGEELVEYPPLPLSEVHRPENQPADDEIIGQMGD